MKKNIIEDRRMEWMSPTHQTMANLGIVNISPGS